ncbi:DUF6082 family protein [Catenuloplanes sp. NPDC051500]|uniref:DUF6082 family protein n=1 Tax=Catenuloplanes sp. NPDC051500 TaxID=3363959 RepID=UPI0037ABC037
MVTGRAGRRRTSMRGAVAFAVLAGVLAAMLLIVVAGIAVVALAENLETSASWSRWANVGESFGVLESLLSGLAFLALVITLWIQFTELRLQRTELQLQRGAIERSNQELRRAADASMRTLHLDLVRMSVDDAALAEVWPGGATVDATLRRQYIFANLIFQHFALSTRLADRTDDEIRGAVRHLFTSPLIRAYWEFSAVERAAMRGLESEAHDRVGDLADEVWRERAWEDPARAG